jgi:uncharacterized protein YidB (DUF937 family)
MAKSGMPSMKALMFLLAIAGYKNRDKISDFIKSMGAPGGALDEAKKKIGEAAKEATAKTGLEELRDQFHKNGEGDKADSWIARGPNTPISEPELDKAAGKDIVDELAKAAGMSREELLKRLTMVLPDAVDKMTPEGKIPA